MLTFLAICFVCLFWKYKLVKRSIRKVHEKYKSKYIQTFIQLTKQVNEQKKRNFIGFFI